MSTGARAARGRPVVQVSLSSEARAMLDALAVRLGASRSATVERLVRDRTDELRGSYRETS